MVAELACYAVEKPEKDTHIYDTTAKLKGKVLFQKAKRGYITNGDVFFSDR